MNNDVEGLQKQIENISNKLDIALHTLADYQRVVAGAVKGGVYENDNHWWHELCRLADNQAVEHTLAVDSGEWCPSCNLPPDEFGDCIRCGMAIAPATKA